MKGFKDEWLQVYNNLLAVGEEVSPRGMKVLELQDFVYEFSPFNRFCGFPIRNLNFQYIRDEFLWYLKGDPRDLSIVDKASIWKDHVTNGQLFSNYGAYWFDAMSGVNWVVYELTNDQDSRRAVIPMLSKWHTFSTNKDVPCTTNIGFRIRDGRLNCSVHMRSQDAWFGLGNDLPAFSFLQEMIFTAIRPTYPDLQMGRLVGHIDSFHVYERHWDKMEMAVRSDAWTDYSVPRMADEDVTVMISPKEVSKTFGPIHFYSWLTSHE